MVRCLLEDGREAALRELAPIAYPPREVPRRPSLSPSGRLAIYRRDGWLCRYCGARTIFTPVMALLGLLFPDDFPYHPNWKNGMTHPAIIARSAVIDHVWPGSLGGSWTDAENLATACWPCNERKGDLTLGQLGWKIRPVPGETGWDGLIGCYRSLWEAAGCPKGGHASWINLVKDAVC